MRRMVALLLVLLLAGCDGIGGSTDVEYLAKAQDYLDKGELRAASIELKNALSKNPKNVQARWLLGKLYVEIGNGAAGEKELRRAWELGVNANAVVPLLARALLLQKKFDQALELEITDLDDPKAVAETLAVKGAAALALSKIDDAERLFNEALRIDKGSARALTGLAGVAVAQRDIDAAYRYLDKALAADPEFAPAWSYKGDLDRFNNRFESALSAYGKAIENRLNNASDLLKRAELLLQQRRIDEAQADADRLKKAAPRSWRVRYLQGRILLAQNKLPEAQESFEYALKISGENLQSYFYLGAVQYLQGNIDSAEQNVGRFYAARNNVPVVRRLLALIKLRQGRFEDAERLVRPLVVRDDSDVLSLNILANALLSQERTREAVVFLRRVVELSPDSAAAQMRLGMGLLQGGEKDEGFRVLEKAVRLDPALQQAETKLITGYLRERKWDSALKAARVFQKRHPDSALAHTLLGLAFRGKGDLPRAESALKRALEIKPGDPTAALNLAAMSIAEGKSEQARRYYEAVLAVHKKHLPAQLALAALDKREGDEKAAITKLEKAVADFPDSIEAHVILAREYLEIGKVEKARTVLGDAIALGRDDPTLLATQGQIELMSRRYTDARLILEELVRLQPDSSQAHLLLGFAYRGLEDNRQAQREFERALQLDPKSLKARIALTVVLLLDGKLEQAKMQLAELKKSGANSPDVLALEAMSQVKGGERGRAVDTYRRLYETARASNTLIAFAGALWLTGDQEGAVGELTRWLSRNPDDVSARLMLASYMAELGRVSEAIDHYEKILAISPDNQVVLNNIAWLLRDVDPARGLDYAEKAWTLNQESAALMDTLSELLLVNGKIDRAQRLNQRALEKDPDSPEYLYRKARILHKKGETATAREVLEVLLRRNVYFEERRDAEAMLDSLKRLG